MFKRLLILALAGGALLLMQACAPLLVAGGATAAVAASERRTLGSFVDDESIEIQARKTITDSDLGDDVHVDITSMNGIVLLSGEATTAEQRDRVVALVRPIPGIRRIVNEIRVAEPSAFASRTNDSWITGKVRAQMLGIKNLQSRQVKVVTENSVVYLMGLVTKQEGDLAAEAARSVGGVQRVVKLFEYID
ncbi:MAG: BON domain-containing protein [Sulfuricaulis sp.]